MRRRFRRRRFRPWPLQNVLDIFIRQHAAVAVGIPGREKDREEQTFGQFFLDQTGCALHQVVILLEARIELSQNSGNRHLRLDEQIEVEWNLVSSFGEFERQLRQPVKDAATLFGFDDLGDDLVNPVQLFRRRRHRTIDQHSQMVSQPLWIGKLDSEDQLHHVFPVPT